MHPLIKPQETPMGKPRSYRKYLLLVEQLYPRLDPGAYGLPPLFKPVYPLYFFITTGDAPTKTKAMGRYIGEAVKAVQAWQEKQRDSHRPLGQSNVLLDDLKKAREATTRFLINLHAVKKDADWLETLREGDGLTYCITKWSRKKKDSPVATAPQDPASI